VLAISCLLSLSVSALASTWNLVDNIGFTTNPDGAWTYGWKAGYGSALNAYPNVADFGVGPSWYGLSYLPTVCLFRVNNYGVHVGEVSLHPGSGEEPSCVRWTAPADTQFVIGGHFGAGDTAWMDAYIYHNGTPIWSALDFSTDRPFAFTETVAAGDTLDFMVGGGYICGNTPLDINIASIPEPGTAALFGLGLVLIVVKRRRPH
jgi:hypothetical protein